ncbi:MAG: peptide-methionine (S)-S-oxide reductase MsrA [Proteobacteria bacterium]|nr:peptide-methionine (S)-S-oxide reductase MsrA [Pseudomonadota bacterium]
MAQQDVAGTATPPKNHETALFAGGCFWCTESDFDKIPGVIETVFGYAGGQKLNPTYEEVSNGGTGHAEVVQVTYDPAKVSYKELVDKFWRTIDPTTPDRQFCDSGSQYRSAIFYSTPQQKAIAEQSKTALEKNKPFKGKIVTEITQATTFYAAEEYHQNFYRKNPVRYNYYRFSCGRDQRLELLWGKEQGRASH